MNDIPTDTDKSLAGETPGQEPSPETNTPPAAAPNVPASDYMAGDRVATDEEVAAAETTPTPATESQETTPAAETRQKQQASRQSSKTKTVKAKQDKKQSKAKRQKKQKAPKQPKQTSPKDGSKRGRGLAVLIGLLLMVGVGIATWYLLSSQDAATPVEVQPVAKEVAPFDDSAYAIIAKLKTDFQENLSEEYPEMIVTDSLATGDQALQGPAFKTDGADYFVSSTDAYGINVANGPVATDAENKESSPFTKAVTGQATTTLEEHDYKKTNTLGQPLEYQSELVICSLLPGSTAPVAITCADKSTYATVSETVKPFANAYLAANPSDNIKQPIFSAVTVKDSASPGYKTATVNIFDRKDPSTISVAALFWTKDDADWQFFTTSSQQAPLCSDYDSDDLRAAFASEQCRPEAGGESVPVSSL